MQILYNEPLASYTSLRCGGPADTLIITENTDELLGTLRAEDVSHVFGYGTNSLISDKGLRGTTVITRGGDIAFDGTDLVVSAGTWWDDVVSAAVEKGLWGIELMSGIPSSVGGAVVGNIAAYGQAIADTLCAVSVFDTKTKQQYNLSAQELELGYRSSNLQRSENAHLVVLSATFRLAGVRKKKLEYESALKVAQDKGFSIDQIDQVREVILLTRESAGSLYDPSKQKGSHHSAGSFFRNPLVGVDQLDAILAFEERGVTAEKIRSQNKIHGGAATRVSAAHVLLAAGYKRGQSWGSVRLHPDHVLKIENIGDAHAQDIYNVVQEIIATVSQKLHITLEPEVRFLGDF